MDSWTVLALLGVGLAVGFINNLAGAAGVLGLIALEELVGLGSAQANTTMRPSALGIGLGGVLGFRSRGRRIPRRAWLYGLVALPGAVAGSILAIELPVLAYRLVLATVIGILLFQQLRGGSTNSDPAPARRPAWLGALLFFLTGVHMGFVQVGTGLVAIIALTTVHSRDLLSVNTAKAAIVLVTAVTSTAILGFSGHIYYPAALPLFLGSFLGSFLASRWSAARGHGALRPIVLVVSTVVLLRIAWQITTVST